MIHRSQLGARTAPRAIILGAIAIAAVWLAPGRASAQGWPSYGHDTQHSCLGVGGSMLPQKIRWKTTVDQNITQGQGGAIYIHYGSPVITRLNTVIVPVKTTGPGEFQISAFSGATGANLWTATTDYVLPSSGWTPICGISLTPKDKSLAYPGAGGTIYVRTFPDTTIGTTKQYGFFNTPTDNYYNSNPSAFNAAIKICTPISVDAVGNLYFGYISTGDALPGYPDGIPSGLAKITPAGVGGFIPATDWYVNGTLVSQGMVSDRSIQKVAMNCAPSFSADGTTLYVAVNNSSDRGYLAAVSTSTLAPKAAALLYDPAYAPNTVTAAVDDESSATPTVGPDGDVYYGVLSSTFSGNHYRGWLLHFNAALTVSKLPNAFGWDDTASVVPSTLVAGYSGPSRYLLLTKYNNYADGNTGGTGINQVAVVDPNMSMVDPISGVTVMQTVIAVTGITPDPSFINNGYPNAVREWCINSAAIDPVNKCALLNSEDGHLYRWDFTSNSLSVTNPATNPPTVGLYLAPSTSEAYTPTVIGPDGAVYAINDAVLYCTAAK